MGRARLHLSYNLLLRYAYIIMTLSDKSIKRQNLCLRCNSILFIQGFKRMYKAMSSTFYTSGDMIEWFLLLVGLITIPIIFFIGRLFQEYKKQYSQRWQTEGLVFDMLERMFPKHRFEKVRPDFLRYPPTGHNLELDAYCADLNVAVEYNGRQHYQYVKFFHGSNPTKFEQQKARDQFKNDRCRELGITLITVPYTVARDSIYTYMYKKMVESGNQKVIEALM